jgi:hypothetical protein
MACSATVDNRESIHNTLHSTLVDIPRSHCGYQVIPKSRQTTRPMAVRVFCHDRGLVQCHIPQAVHRSIANPPPLKKYRAMGPPRTVSQVQGSRCRNTAIVPLWHRMLPRDFFSDSKGIPRRDISYNIAS